MEVAVEIETTLETRRAATKHVQQYAPTLLQPRQQDQGPKYARLSCVAYVPFLQLKDLVGPARNDFTMINKPISAGCSFMVAAGEMEITLKQRRDAGKAAQINVFEENGRKEGVDQVDQVGEAEIECVIGVSKQVIIILFLRN